MRAFNVRALLRTHLSLSHPLHLDGLLLAARERMEDRLDLTRPLECIAMQDGVYRASAGLLVAPGLQGMARQSIRRTWRFRLDDAMGQAPFKVTAESLHKERVLPIANSKYRNGFRRQELLTGIESVVWQCVGDQDAVLRLTRGIHGLGLASNTGYGEIREWAIEPCDASDAEAGWLSGDRVLRNLPERLVPTGVEVDRSKASLDTQRGAPPYWDQDDRERCWVPFLDALVVDADAADRLLQAA